MKDQRHIFRERAIIHAVHQRQQDVLPHLMRPAVFLCLWLVLFLLLFLLVVMMPGVYQRIGG